MSVHSPTVVTFIYCRCKGADQFS